ncbi:MAG: hypothetical protein RL208_704 [Pseudomonadota bacterium]|jgi:hypothetical protein
MESCTRTIHDVLNLINEGRRGVYENPKKTRDTIKLNGKQFACYYRIYYDIPVQGGFVISRNGDNYTIQYSENGQELKEYGFEIDGQGNIIRTNNENRSKRCIDAICEVYGRFSENDFIDTTLKLYIAANGELAIKGNINELRELINPLASKKGIQIGQSQDGKFCIWLGSKDKPWQDVFNNMTEEFKDYIKKNAENIDKNQANKEAINKLIGSVEKEPLKLYIANKGELAINAKTEDEIQKISEKYKKITSRSVSNEEESYIAFALPVKRDNSYSLYIPEAIVNDVFKNSPEFAKYLRENAYIQNDQYNPKDKQDKIKEWTGLDKEINNSNSDKNLGNLLNNLNIHK